MSSPLSGNIVFLDQGMMDGDIDYPDSDGEQIAETTLQAHWIFLLYGNFWALFASKDTFVAADLFWYPVEGDPKIRLAPDIMVAFGRPDGHRGSYKQWVEDNIPAHVIIEVLAPLSTTIEIKRKLAFYEKYGASEFIVLDPEKHTFEVYLRDGNKLLPVNIENKRWRSPSLKLLFRVFEGKLKVFHIDGSPFKTLEEMLIEREIFKKKKQNIQAETNDILTTTEKLHAENERLKARLRELGEKLE